MREDEFRVLDGLYVLHETIGRGGFAKVKKATHVLTGERVAIKILDKLALGEDLPRVHREIETLKSLNHPHICKMFQVMETESKIFIIMEYCRGGELFDYIVQKDRLNEDEARRIFRQIAAAIAYVHARGVAHRDLKPENILLDAENNVKLIDFGLCASLKTGLFAELETCCGSPAYAAPELIRGQKYIGTLADVWSLGVLLYALLCGSLPFDDPTLGVLYKKIQAGKYDEPRWLSEGSKNILRCMLQTSADFRLSVHELLNHTWCQEGSPETLPVVSSNDSSLKVVLDIDVLRLMGSHLGASVQIMENRISPFDYTSFDVATYLILLQRKQTAGTKNFRMWGMNLERIPILNNRVQKSLESDFLECDNVEVTPVAPARHASMDGGLDDSHLLTFGSPKMKESEHQDKENVDDVDFARPRIPTPKRTKAIISQSQETPLNGKVSKHLSPARSAECVMTDSLRTPVRNRHNNGNFSPNALPSPARRKVLGSLERGLDKVRHMLTPRTSKIKKPRSIATYEKGANNVSTTGSTDAEFVLEELKASLLRIEVDYVQKGYRIVSKSNAIKFELEVVYIQDFRVIGIRRKRHRGDSWLYKKIMDQVLTLTGDCQAAKQNNVPLQTMV